MPAVIVRVLLRLRLVLASMSTNVQKFEQAAIADVEKPLSCRDVKRAARADPAVNLLTTSKTDPRWRCVLASF